MSDFLIPVIDLLVTVLEIYKWVLIITAVCSWLIAFGVLNTYNRNVSLVLNILWRLTEPALQPIRRFVPSIGGIDISFIILFLLIILVQHELVIFEAHLYVPRVFLR